MQVVAIPSEGGSLTAKTFELPGELDAAVAFAMEHNTRRKNIYFAPNPPKRKLSKKLSRDDVAQVEYCHADIDRIDACRSLHGRCDDSLYLLQPAGHRLSRQLSPWRSVG